MKYILLLISFSISNLYCSDIDAKSIAQKLSIQAGKKASIQWERIFSNSRKMKRYKINTLTEKEQKILKEYILDHAADSDSPELAGEFS